MKAASREKNYGRIQGREAIKSKKIFGRASVRHENQKMVNKIVVREEKTDETKLKDKS